MKPQRGLPQRSDAFHSLIHDNTQGGFMEIIGALQQEESKLQRQLTAVQSAIAALNDVFKPAVSTRHTSSQKGANAKRTMSPAVRAKIARSAKARWAKIRAKKLRRSK